ncbi:ATP-binding cassette domain-containing protein [Streptomyces sp. AK010]|uniref:ATP-binding cassette domain-containing protein n=1 Tax=Streptomyces sp. AK010 TaxID=2723074 RepID=UPI0017FCD855|nr:ATP-binding cassette domain-containing protein [Streptomyces sp. AK010]MBB6419006.1 ABC-type transport system involved in cytochrome c biogenesis ATPase subunit [Streptomyces sp. AK010]
MDEVSATQPERSEARAGTGEPVIATRGLTKRYRGGHLAVDGLDLTVPAGSVFGFLGPNGSGKTTTRRMLMGLIEPTSGTARVLGQPMPRATRAVLPHGGALIEGPALYGFLSGRDNLIRYDSADPAADPRTRRTRVASALDRVGLTSAAGKKAKAYSLGTLRYLLVAPAGRSRLLLTKYATVVVFCLAATLVVAVSALTVGALLFPLGDLTTISGTQISFADGLGRALLIALAVAASLIGVAALGLFVSTMTGSGIAAMATTVGLLITVQILDQIPQLHALQPYFFSHYWLSFADLMREPVHWDDLTKNLGLQALYAAVFGSAAWARFTAKDITA